MQPRGKMTYDYNMLDGVTETRIMQAAGTFTAAYDARYDSQYPIIHHHMHMKQRQM